MNDFIPCRIAQLPAHQQVEAAVAAKDINPANAPFLEGLASLTKSVAGALGLAAEEGERAAEQLMTPQHIAVLTTKYWGKDGAKQLGVGFFGNPTAGTRNKVLSYMNKWGLGGRSSVKFVEASRTMAEIRIDFQASGYWSYLGTDCKSIPSDKQTLNLQGFTEGTSDAEYDRVVCHEAGHALGCPHEHMRADAVARLDVEKTVAYFRQTQGWSRGETMQQVLTPVSEVSLLSPTPVDYESIMCYQLPGSITKDGQPIRGGSHINTIDADYCAKVYPGAAGPVTPPVPSTALTLEQIKALLEATLARAQARNPANVDAILAAYHARYLLPDFAAKFSTPGDLGTGGLN